jgi:hypothetical protein
MNLGNPLIRINAQTGLWGQLRTLNGGRTK